MADETRKTFTVTDGGILKRRVMRRVGEKIALLEQQGWVAPSACEWQIAGIARIAVAVVLHRPSSE